MTEEEAPQTPAEGRRISPSVVIILVVVALFAGVILAKSQAARTAAPAASEAGTVASAPTGVSGTTITSTHNDAVADYEAALASGKPVYLLFHSLTCDPCVEISAVVDNVMPAYEGKVVFVNAISDDPSGRQLASQFQFQYIPTSFFITPEGKVADSFTGSMSDTDMKARLDALISR